MNQASGHLWRRNGCVQGPQDKGFKQRKWKASIHHDPAHCYYMSSLCVRYRVSSVLCHLTPSIPYPVRQYFCDFRNTGSVKISSHWWPLFSRATWMILRIMRILWFRSYSECQPAEKSTPSDTLFGWNREEFYIFRGQKENAILRIPRGLCWRLLGSGNLGRDFSSLKHYLGLMEKWNTGWAVPFLCHHIDRVTNSIHRVIHHGS